MGSGRDLFGFYIGSEWLTGQIGGDVFILEEIDNCCHYDHRCHPVRIQIAVYGWRFARAHGFVVLGRCVAVGQESYGVGSGRVVSPKTVNHPKVQFRILDGVGHELRFGFHELVAGDIQEEILHRIYVNV